MPSPLGRQYGLASRGSAGLSWDDEGLALGCVPLVTSELGLGGKWRYVVRPAAEVSKALRLAYDSEPDEVIDRYQRGLQRVFDLFEAGESGRAGVQAVLLGLPEISPEGTAKLAEAADLVKAAPVGRINRASRAARLAVENGQAVAGRARPQERPRMNLIHRDRRHRRAR